MIPSYKVYLHQLIENEGVLAFYLDKFAILHFMNMSNLVQISINGTFIPGIAWTDYDPIRPSKLEIVVQLKITIKLLYS